MFVLHFLAAPFPRFRPHQKNGQTQKKSRHQGAASRRARSDRPAAFLQRPNANAIEVCDRPYRCSTALRLNVLVPTAEAIEGRRLMGSGPAAVCGVQFVPISGYPSWRSRHQLHVFAQRDRGLSCSCEHWAVPALSNFRTDGLREWFWGDAFVPGEPPTNRGIPAPARGLSGDVRAGREGTGGAASRRTSRQERARSATSASESELFADRRDGVSRAETERRGCPAHVPARRFMLRGTPSGPLSMRRSQARH